MNSTLVILQACQEISARMSSELLDWQGEALNDFVTKEQSISDHADPCQVDPRQRESEDESQFTITIPYDWASCLITDCQQLSQLIGMISDTLDSRPKEWMTRRPVRAIKRRKTSPHPG